MFARRDPVAVQTRFKGHISTVRVGLCQGSYPNLAVNAISVTSQYFFSTAMVDEVWICPFGVEIRARAFFFEFSQSFWTGSALSATERD